MRYRRWVLGGLGVAAVAVASLVVYDFTASGGPGTSTSHQSASHQSALSKQAASQQPVAQPLKPVPFSLNTSVLQYPMDRELDPRMVAAANSQKALWAEMERITLPPPIPSSEFPAIPHALRQNADTYANAFVHELLSINFAKQSRQALLDWAQSEVARDTLPGIPARIWTTFLYSNLTSSSTPLPTPAQWAANAAAGVRWSVSGVEEIVYPKWSELMSTGWLPPDPRMTALDVTGNLTITQPGHAPKVRPFTIEVELATAKYHNGYGTVSVNNWILG